MSNKEIKPLGRRADIVIQEYGNEILIYDLTIHKAFSLNETSALVWQACDGTKTVGEISRHISRQLKSPVNEDFVWLALDQLKQENLIENEVEISAPFKGLSRREVIRKVGFATMVALPVVASLIAPTAALAQSGCGAATNRPNGCTCSGATNCASNCCGNNGTSNQCVTAGLEPTGSPCRAGCECASGSCPSATRTCA